MRAEIQCFHHFGVNTYTGREWGLGNEDPNIFQPHLLNTSQWMEACRDLGAPQSILVAKHHDGFMLYPTEHTNHSVVSSSWRNGTGDVVADFMQSAHKYGIEPAFYLSPWDRNQYNMTWNPAYSLYYEKTFKVLLERYGSFFQLWWDGANGGGTPPSVYPWSKWMGMLREHQPSAVGGGCEEGPTGFDCGPDTAHIGNEDGTAPEDLWLAHPSSMEFTNDTVFAPYFCDVSIRPGWFYHPDQEHICSDGNAQCYGIKSLSKLVDIYFTSVGHNGVLQLNVPPNRDGLLSDNDVAQMRRFGAYLRKTFAVDLAASPRGSSQLPWAPACSVLDEDMETYWEPEASDKTPFLTIGHLAGSGNVIMVQEAIQHGQRIAGWVIEGHSKTNSDWTVIARGITIGRKRLLRQDLTGVTALRFRVNATVAGTAPRLARFGVFHAPDPRETDVFLV